MPARIPIRQPLTLRRLLLVRTEGATGDPDTGHLCLVPVESGKEESWIGKILHGFACPCGVLFDGTAELAGYTTEYERRCVNAFRPMIDNRRIA